MCIAYVYTFNHVKYDTKVFCDLNIALLPIDCTWNILILFCINVIFSLLYYSNCLYYFIRWVQSCIVMCEWYCNMHDTFFEWLIWLNSASDSIQICGPVNYKKCRYITIVYSMIRVGYWTNTVFWDRVLWSDFDHRACEVINPNKERGPKTLYEFNNRLIIYLYRTVKFIK